MSFLNRTYVVRDIKATGTDGVLVRELMKLVASLGVDEEVSIGDRLEFWRLVRKVNEIWWTYENELNCLAVGFMSVSPVVAKDWVIDNPYTKTKTLI